MRDADDILVERRGAVTTIVLNRPDKLNALDDAAVRALARAVRAVSRSDAAVVVLVGAGRAFSAGADRRTLSPHGTHDDQVRALAHKGLLVAAIRSLPQVTIAAINGPCAGLAIGIAGACQLRYASDSAVFNTAYLSLGLAGDFGVADALVKAIGESAALDWLLRPRKISSTEALTQGFVQDLFTAEDFTAQVTRLAGEIAAASPVARAAIVANVSDAANRSLELSDYLQAEAERHVTAKAASAAS